MKRRAPSQATQAQMKRTMGTVVGKSSYGEDDELWDRLSELGFFFFFEKSPVCLKCKHPPQHPFGPRRVALFPEVPGVWENEEPPQGDVAPGPGPPQVHPRRCWMGDGEECVIPLRRDGDVTQHLGQVPRHHAGCCRPDSRKGVGQRHLQAGR